MVDFVNDNRYHSHSFIEVGHFMNIQTSLVYCVLFGLSFVLLKSLQKNAQLTALSSTEGVPYYRQTKRLWLGYFAAIFALCFFQNADYLIALAYVIFVFAALGLLAKKWPSDILAEQSGLYERPLGDVPFRPDMTLKLQGSTRLLQNISGVLRVFNLILLSPILAAATGLLYRAYSLSVEANSIVFTGFIASLTYALFLLYFVSVKRVALSTVLGLVFVVSVVLAISFSSKVAM
jgi:hypothetical protein